MENTPQKNPLTSQALEALKHAVYETLKTYSNVHRGSGLYSQVTTSLYEQAREIVLAYLGLDRREYVTIFCSSFRFQLLSQQLKPEDYKSISGRETGLPLGVTAIAVRKKSLPYGAPVQTGGGSARLVSRNWIIWAKEPDKFEAGTPAIINVIAFATGLQLIMKYGIDIFLNLNQESMSAADILYHDDYEHLSGRQLLEELRNSMVGRGITVPALGGSKPYINFDNAASTQSFLPVWKTFCEAIVQSDIIRNEIITEVRAICARALGSPLSEYDIIFTSNTTEAINLAAENLKSAIKRDIEPVILNTMLEHTSNDLPWRMIPGSSLLRLPVTEEGFIEMKELEELLSDYNEKMLHGNKRIVLLALSGASNVLGICNNLPAAGNIIHRYGAHLLVDAAQLVAHREINMQDCGIDFLAFSSHKMYAPFGTGALVARKGLLSMNKDLLSEIRLSGEENIGGIAACGKAFVLLQRAGMDVIQAEEQVLTAKAINALAKIPGLQLYGLQDPGSPGFIHRGGVIVFNMKGMMADKVTKVLSFNGIGSRFGCHCAHILIKHLIHLPPALERFQALIVTVFPKINLPGLARVSFGIGNTEEEIDLFIEALKKIKADKVMQEGRTLQNQNRLFVKNVASKVYSPEVIMN